MAARRIWETMKRHAGALSFGTMAGGAFALLVTAVSDSGSAQQPRAAPKEDKVKPKRRQRQFHEAIKKADEVVRRFKEERGVPGISVGVSVDGTVVWKKGYGYSDVENLVPCTEDTNMRIASISKSLTMTIVAKLLQDKLLDLDAPVQKYVPSFPEKEFDGQKVTITTRHLVSHLSGMRHYQKQTGSSASEATTTTTSSAASQKTANASDSKPRNVGVEKSPTSTPKAVCETCQRPLNEPVQSLQSVSEFQNAEYYSQKQYDSVTEALSMFKDDPLLWKPGTKYGYTTHGWTLVSAVIEGASGKTFPALFKELFTIFGMRQTFLDENNPIIPNRAKYYQRSAIPHRLENAPAVNNSYKWAGGGVVSTVGDLLSFANALLYFYHRCPDGVRTKDCYLDRKTLNEIWTPVEMAPLVWAPGGHYAMGWSVTPDRTLRHDGEFYVSHTGGAIGASSVLLLKPIRRNDVETETGGVAVAVLTNIEECGRLHPLAVELAEIFDRSRPAEKWRRDG